MSETYDQFVPTSEEEAAKQSNPNRGLDIVADILQPGTPVYKWEEGDNWMRFIKTGTDPWFIPVTYYEMKAGDKLARVVRRIDQEECAQLLLDVQIGLYNDPATRPLMRTKENQNGFSFREHRKAYLVASRWESTLGSFSIVAVTMGRPPYKKDQKYREAWGDALIKIPTEREVDPTLSNDPTYKGKSRWGSIFDPVDGRLIKCSFANVGTLEISASFLPGERLVPLGDWVINGQVVEERPVPKGASFKPRAQFEDVLKHVPSLRASLKKLTIDEQVNIIRTFIPVELKAKAEAIMELKLKEYKSGTRSARPAATVATAAPAAPAAQNIAVPPEEPTELGAHDQIYIEFVKALGPKFALVGEAAVRKLIQINMVNANSLAFMATLPPESLKSAATAAV